MANPHSLYILQDIQRANGKLLYWRIGRPAPRVLFRGKFDSAGNCGNRALLIRGRTLKLLTPGGKTVLTRRISSGNYFSMAVCSGNYLHFLDVVNDDDYYGNSPFVRHLANTSRLPR